MIKKLRRTPMVTEHQPLFLTYEYLTNLPQSDDALLTLRKAASAVKPLMRKRGWTVRVLCEFLPPQASLLGLNVNSTERIMLRLRYTHNPSSFLTFEKIIDTLLHELSHIRYSNHGEDFMKLLNQLRDEYSTLRMHGFTGQSFLSEGRVLGGGCREDFSLLSSSGRRGLAPPVLSSELDMLRRQRSLARQEQRQNKIQILGKNQQHRAVQRPPFKQEKFRLGTSSIAATTGSRSSTGNHDKYPPLYPTWKTTTTKMPNGADRRKAMAEAAVARQIMMAKNKTKNKETTPSEETATANLKNQSMIKPVTRSSSKDTSKGAGGSRSRENLADAVVIPIIIDDDKDGDDTHDNVNDNDNHDFDVNDKDNDNENNSDSDKDSDNNNLACASMTAVEICALVRDAAKHAFSTQTEAEFDEGLGVDDGLQLEDPLDRKAKRDDNHKEVYMEKNNDNDKEKENKIDHANTTTLGRVRGIDSDVCANINGNEQAQAKAGTSASATENAHPMRKGQEEGEKRCALDSAAVVGEMASPAVKPPQAQAQALVHAQQASGQSDHQPPPPPHHNHHHQQETNYNQTQEWPCPACTLLNVPSASVCDACGLERGRSSTLTPTSASGPRVIDLTRPSPARVPRPTVITQSSPSPPSFPMALPSSSSSSSFTPTSFGLK